MSLSPARLFARSFAAIACLRVAAAVQLETHKQRPDGRPRIVQLKLPCSGSQWFHSSTRLTDSSQLFAGTDVAHGVSSASMMKRMLHELDAKDGNNTVYSGFTTNPLCVAPGVKWAEVGRHSTHVVAYRRTNLAKMAVSAIIKADPSEACHHHNVKDEKTAAECQQAKYTIDSGTLLEGLTLAACQSSFLEDTATKIGKPIIHAYYEDMQTHPTEVISYLSSQLGAPVSFHTEGEFAKKTREDLSKQIKNFDELLGFVNQLDITETCPLQKMMKATTPEVFDSCNVQSLCKSLHAEATARFGQTGHPFNVVWPMDRPPYMFGQKPYENTNEAYILKSNH